MRIEFIDANSKHEALISAPWAKKIVKLEFGYLAFENKDDYLQWKNATIHRSFS